MSWQLGAFTVLAISLAAGFAWYERSRPDARTVALVATMAALATVGRIAFAALPNVKPSTDIVLITGYAIGGAPGFVVGAITGLVSNFFFGQGPWTVWQMTAWALTGAGGAALARVTRGRIGRWPLAAVCFVVGYAFAAFQDFGDWVNYSDHSLAQLGVYVGQGTGFDFIHAGGCVAFALAFGPALIRALERFQRRLHITWLAPEGAALPGVLLIAALAGTVLVPPNPARAATTPAGYLVAAQNSDGGLGAGPGLPSVQLYSGWAALGLAAEGINAADVRRGGTNLLAYIESSAPSLPDVGSLERTILVARAAGMSATSFGGRNLLAELRGHIGGDGSVSEQVNLTSFAVLALRAAGAPVGARTMAWLRHQQNSDGGFSFGTAGGASDVDDTGAALEALAAGGAGSGHAAGRAVAFIRAAQNGDGGVPEQPGGLSNAQSSAFAVQGLLAVGVDPRTVQRRGRSLEDYLRSLEASDGHVRYSAASDQTPVWVTAEALMALAGRALPLGPVPLAPAPAPHHTAPRPAPRRQSAPAATRHRVHRPAVRRRSARVAAAQTGLGPIALEVESAVMSAVDRVLSALGLPTPAAAGA